MKLDPKIETSFQEIKRDYRSYKGYLENIKRVVGPEVEQEQTWKVLTKGYQNMYDKYDRLVSLMMKGLFKLESRNNMMERRKNDAEDMMEEYSDRLHESEFQMANFERNFLDMYEVFRLYIYSKSNQDIGNDLNLIENQISSLKDFLLLKLNKYSFKTKQETLKPSNNDRAREQIHPQHNDSAGIPNIGSGIKSDISLTNCNMIGREIEKIISPGKAELTHSKSESRANPIENKEDLNIWDKNLKNKHSLQYLKQKSQIVSHKEGQDQSKNADISYNYSDTGDSSLNSLNKFGLRFGQSKNDASRMHYSNMLNNLMAINSHMSGGGDQQNLSVMGHILSKNLLRSGNSESRKQGWSNQDYKINGLTPDFDGFNSVNKDILPNPKLSTANDFDRMNSMQRDRKKINSHDSYRFYNILSVNFMNDGNAGLNPEGMNDLVISNIKVKPNLEAERSHDSEIRSFREHIVTMESKKDIVINDQIDKIAARKDYESYVRKKTISGLDEMSQINKRRSEMKIKVIEDIKKRKSEMKIREIENDHSKDIKQSISAFGLKHSERNQSDAFNLTMDIGLKNLNQNDASILNHLDQQSQDNDDSGVNMSVGDFPDYESLAEKNNYDNSFVNNILKETVQTDLTVVKENSPSPKLDHTNYGASSLSQTLSTPFNLESRNFDYNNRVMSNIKAPKLNFQESVALGLNDESFNVMHDLGEHDFHFEGCGYEDEVDGNSQKEEINSVIEEEIREGEIAHTGEIVNVETKEVDERLKEKIENDKELEGYTKSISKKLSSTVEDMEEIMNRLSMKKYLTNLQQNKSEDEICLEEVHNKHPTSLPEESIQKTMDNEIHKIQEKIEIYSDYETNKSNVKEKINPEDHNNITNAEPIKEIQNIKEIDPAKDIPENKQMDTESQRTLFSALEDYMTYKEEEPPKEEALPLEKMSIEKMIVDQIWGADSENDFIQTQNNPNRKTKLNLEEIQETMTVQNESEQGIKLGEETNASFEDHEQELSSIQFAQRKDENMLKDNQYYMDNRDEVSEENMMSLSRKNRSRQPHSGLELPATDSELEEFKEIRSNNTQYKDITLNCLTETPSEISRDPNENLVHSLIDIHKDDLESQASTKAGTTVAESINPRFSRDSRLTDLRNQFRKRNNTMHNLDQKRSFIDSFSKKTDKKGQRAKKSSNKQNLYRNKSRVIPVYFVWSWFDGSLIIFMNTLINIIL